MNEVIQFIKDYWTYISVVILVLFDLIVLLVKRRPKTIDDFVFCLDATLTDLPNFINRYEQPGHGAEKKEAVIHAARSLISQRLGRELSDYEVNTVNREVSKQIEFILSTPTKKEGK